LQDDGIGRCYENRQAKHENPSLYQPHESVYMRCIDRALFEWKSVLFSVGSNDTAIRASESAQGAVRLSDPNVYALRRCSELLMGPVCQYGTETLPRIPSVIPLPYAATESGALPP